MKPLHHQGGASLIEVLVAILLLSFGMLSLGGMLAYAVQMPKLAAYRAAAANLAAGHIERMRANTAGFANESYKETMSYNATLPTVTPCSYPNCTADSIAALDKNETGVAIRRELPLGGMRMTCNGACTALDGDLWIVWQEPSTFAAMNATDSDECPDATASPTFTAFQSPKPRCLHVRFKL
ncbi:MAG: type IV pilus modification protein PilV [Pseudomonadota bacterium]